MDEPDLPFDWRHVPPSDQHTLDDWRDRGGLVLDMVRRGVDHGALVIGDVPPTPTADATVAWQDSRPVFRPDAITDAVAAHAAACQDTLEMFDRLRDGARFLDELERRLWNDDTFRYQSSTVDALDEREIEKVFVEVPTAEKGRYRARNLSAKLSWIANDERDTSLRIRFSFGHEATGDWLTPDEHALWSDRFAAAVFPECAAITDDAALGAELRALRPDGFRLSERIIYNNVPGGGAVFHHDADPGQRGVVFAQLSGVTIWLALPRVELERRARAHLPDLDAGAFDGDPPPELATLLNGTPAFTAELIAAGHLFALGPGDVLLLPSHDPERCAWHSVFGTGDAPSLAHSYAIFDPLP